MNKVLISLGTNMGDRKQNLVDAYELVENRMGIILEKSSIYITPPWGFNSEMDFYNSMILLETDLGKTELLLKMQQIETDLGRLEKIKPTYEDRCIDLDIIDYNGMTFESDNLILPHPRLHLRKFVLIPLQEICPEWKHPKLELTLLSLVNQLEDETRIDKLKD